MSLEEAITQFKPNVPKGYIIRPIKPSDYHSGYLQLLSQLTTVGTVTEQQFKNTLSLMQAQNKQCIVIEDENGTLKALGSVVIEHKLIHDCQSCGHIEDIVVDARARGTGLGKCIIDQLILISKIMGCYKTVLTCADKNIGFYEKCGFEKKSVNMAIYF
jgi:ribosomal protein S18 acetylase RimI-like enzyme